MSLLAIRVVPEAILRQKAKPIRRIDESIRKLADDMLETMHFASGVGLAAPQVGVSLRMVVIQVPEEEPYVLINPEIVDREGSYEVSEGCLSIPGYRGDIMRSVSVMVKARDKQGKTIRIKATELLAQALEHEIEHLDGILYIDHIEGADRVQPVEEHLDSLEKLHKIEPEPAAGSETPS